MKQKASLKGRSRLFPKKIVSEQTLAIDAVSGASMTTKGILEAVEDCAKQAGGDLTVLKQAKATAENKEVEEITVDVAVVGAGAAGTAAALAAEDSGASVVLLEKNSYSYGRRHHGRRDVCRRFSAAEGQEGYSQQAMAL
ncbi:FAD-dependent oxidoreductase [Paenibacillus rhizoplanae]